MNYKKITINFNLKDAYDKKMYEYLMSIKYKTAYLKKIIEEDMKNEV